MFYESEEERRKREELERWAREMGLDVSAISSSMLGQVGEDEVLAKQAEEEIPVFETTREAAEYAWDKYMPKGRELKMSGDLGDFSYYDEELGEAKGEEEKEEMEANLAKNSQNQSSGLLTSKKKQLFEEKENEYQDKYSGNEAWVGAKNMNSDDWKDVRRKAVLGVEKGVDAYTLGGYSQLNKAVGFDYDKQNQEYHKMAQDAGVGKWAKNNDLLIDTTASASGPGTWVSKIFGSPAGKGSSYIATDIVNSGITNANRSGDISNQEKFVEGALGSASMQLIELLKKLGLI